jgi:hypothetical protein
MTNPKNDPKFNETLRRMMESPPKRQDKMKKGREPKPAPKSDQRSTSSSS